MRAEARIALKIVTIAGLLFSSPGTAHAANPCPPGFGFTVNDGARIHRFPDLKSPVDGLYYSSHSYRVNRFIGGAPTTPEWVDFTNTTTGVSGFVHGSVAGCAGLTPPRSAEW